MSNSRAEDLPGAETIHLRAGETVFWNGNIIHRACHRAERERLTLIASYKAYRADEPPQDVGRFQFLLNDSGRLARSLARLLRPLEISPTRLKFSSRPAASCPLGPDPSERDRRGFRLSTPYR